MEDREVIRRLDKMVAILQLAHHEQIEQARVRIRADELNAAILDAAVKRIAAGSLTAAVRKAVKKAPSERTVARRVAALVDQGALEQFGAGSKVFYQVTGLV